MGIGTKMESQVIVSMMFGSLVKQVQGRDLRIQGQVELDRLLIPLRLIDLHLLRHEEIVLVLREVREGTIIISRPLPHDVIVGGRRQAHHIVRSLLRRKHAITDAPPQAMIVQRLRLIQLDNDPRNHSPQLVNFLNLAIVSHWRNGRIDREEWIMIELSGMHGRQHRNNRKSTLL